MGVRTSEACWTVHKCQVINLRNCCIYLVDLFEFCVLSVVNRLKSLANTHLDDKICTEIRRELDANSQCSRMLCLIPSGLLTEVFIHHLVSFDWKVHEVSTSQWVARGAKSLCIYYQNFLTFCAWQFTISQFQRSCDCYYEVFCTCT